MTKVTKKQEAQLALKNDQASWGGQNVDASDILIPKLYIVQPQSAICKNDPKNYQGGMILRSTDKKALGDSDEAISFIPLLYNKNWIIEKKEGTKFKYHGIEDHTPANAGDPWSWQVEGVEYRRNATINFFVLLKNDIDKERAALEDMEKTGELPDPDAAMFPTCISFSRTSYNAGKVLLTHITKAQSFNMNPAVSMFGLKSAVQQKGDDTWFASHVEKVSKTDASDLPVCKKWFDILSSSSSIKVDDSADVQHTDVTDETSGQVNNDF